MAEMRERRKRTREGKREEIQRQKERKREER